MSPWYRASTTPRPLPPSYEAHLPSLNAAALKRMARLWVGKEASKLNKDGCMRAIRQGLTDPAAMQAVRAELTEFERAGLGLLKRYGQTAPTDVLAAELLMLGLPFKDPRGGPRIWSSQHSVDYGALNALLHRGVVLLQNWQQSYGYPGDLYLDDYHYSAQVFSEPCLLVAGEPRPPLPLDLTPVTPAAASLARQPAEVVLRLISLVETLRKLGPIPRTTKGRITKPFFSKLAKMLGWDASLGQDAMAPLADSTQFFFWLLAGLGFYEPTADGALQLSAGSMAFFEAPYASQAARWLQAYRLLTGWVEHRPAGVWGEDSSETYYRKFLSLRAALLLALAALPEPTAWYRMHDLSARMFDRLGEYVSLGYRVPFYASYHAEPAKQAQERDKWRQQLQQSWERSELPWLLSALRGPLLHLGLLEVAQEPEQRQSGATLFRLTGLGQEVLYEALRAPQPTAPGPAPAASQQDGRCWIVQPNFDVVVYLDQASATALAFIERIAARQPSSGATALYHLTRETIYAALESGLEASSLLTTLRAASLYAVPDNVQQMLAEWAARRERLTLYRTAQLAEFPDQASRDAALASAAYAGKPVGSRFILLTAASPAGKTAPQPARTVDYAAPLTRCLQVAEDGAVHIHQGQADVLVRGEVAAWADQEQDDSHWRLSCASVQRAVQAGWSAASIIDNLAQRALRPAPALLLVAIRAWAGERSLPRQVAMASDILLQIADPSVAQAIAGSPLLQPYLRGQLGPQTFLVHQEQAASLQQRLRELGLQVGSDLLMMLASQAPAQAGS
ncbi:MAG: helicase-associated domain-containing protein [Candidatus Tectimicrobiota bacterium]